ncbi:valine--tRNA ligase [Candidatus Saccharibacteria bacterium]|nr:MAG: valine--tRNA ligase [Candidatus Saccharibacteria bacterium]
MKLPKSYDPNQYETTTYALWESGGFFKPRGKGEPYSIVMPPPNANGNLHIGHALTLGLEDILIRYHRMKGRDTLFIPGADHAGFETWVVYERYLSEQGKSRFDYTREELYQQVWDFVSEKRGTMELQSRALGTSADWDSLVFTLDEKVIKTVYATFKKLWDEGLVYRGERIVNFCTVHQTSFADIEVVHKEEPGKLWEIAYPIVDQGRDIVVATTRPETMLGDTAVAVHPDDPRYKDLIGQQVHLPLTNRTIPIIADEYVDREFGTGAVKITPAHDPNDFEIGKRHDLPMIEVIESDGTINREVGGIYGGETVATTRERIVADLEINGSLRGTKDLVHSVAHCYKCDSIIEPLVRKQWFLKVRPLAERAKQAIEAGEIGFTPHSRAQLLSRYYDNLLDWNLSRQIPWGIPIPAFRNVDDEDDWVFDERVEQTTITRDGKTYVRDEDTFDTWFSSGQWPFITTDFLDQGDYARFYPVSVMETAGEILYAWVARMIMLGLYAADQVPFKDVYLHGLVLDEKGQKMSKSKGNVINPMDAISEYGSDALRIGLAMNRSAGQNQGFSTATVQAGRNFCNKLWNIARFIESKVGEGIEPAPTPESIADHWVLSRLEYARASIEKQLGEFRFAEAADTMYHTIWDDVADWYLEASKAAPNEPLLLYVLETCLKLAHPFAPFVTEAIWTTLQRSETPLIVTPWPAPAEYNDIAAAEFEQLKVLVTETRFVARELPGGKQTLLYEHDSLIGDNETLIAQLANLATVRHVERPSGLRLAVPNREAWLQIDADALYEHQTKLESRLAETRERVHTLQLRLDNEGYVKSAPPAIVNQTRDELDEQLELESRLQNELSVLSENS